MKFKEISLYVLDRQTRSWTQNQPVIEQAMIGRKYTMKENDINKRLIKSPWGSFVKVEHDDAKSTYYAMNQSCQVVKFDNYQETVDFYLKRLM